MVGGRNINGETFYFNGTDKLVEKFSCQIVSLEVYRGREQTFQISHHGFSLTDNGAVEVHIIILNQICLHIEMIVSSVCISDKCRSIGLQFK